MRLQVLAAAALAAVAGGVSADATLSIAPLGTYRTGLYDKGGAEIPSYDALTRRGFIVNAGIGQVEVLNLADPANPSQVRGIDLATECGLPAGVKPNSVDVRLGLVAVAVEAPVKSDPGYVAFFGAVGSVKCLGTVQVGAQPDMVTFSPDGRYVLTANEGEPEINYVADPEGSVSVIDLWRAGRSDFVRTAGFHAYDDPEERARLVAAGVRLFGRDASVSQDLEPESIAISGNRAYVTLQEANALAIVDIAGAKVEKIVALGTKDHSVPGQGLDAGDRDGAGGTALINIANRPVAGMYMPDGIAALHWRGKTFLVTANEGDARDWGDFAEEIRVGSSSYRLDPAAFPDAAALKGNAQLGRLNVSKFTGDTDGDGDFDRIDAFGARSVAVWDAGGKLVWDSGDILEQEVARLFPQNFNTGHTTNALDDRSDNKGPEPEGVTLGQVGGRTYAFVGLERISGIAVFDVSNPTAPAFVKLVVNRDFSQATKVACTAPATGDCPNDAAGDLGPEGLEFVPAWLSPTRKALLIAGNEVSGTTTVWQVE